MREGVKEGAEAAEGTGGTEEGEIPGEGCEVEEVKEEEGREEDGAGKEDVVDGDLRREEICWLGGCA